MHRLHFVVDAKLAMDVTLACLKMLPQLRRLASRFDEYLAVEFGEVEARPGSVAGLEISMALGELISTITRIRGHGHVLSAAAAAAKARAAEDGRVFDYRKPVSVQGAAVAGGEQGGGGPGSAEAAALALRSVADRAKVRCLSLSIYICMRWFASDSPEGTAAASACALSPRRGRS